MLFDGFTLLAEIVNFLILVFLLKRFLYDRIIDIAEAREAKIADRFEEAEADRQRAEEEAQEYRAQRRELDEERESILAEAREAAEEQRKEMVAQARSDVEQKQTKWQETLIREQERFLRELHQLAGQQLHAIARRALADLADSDLEQQVVTVFLERLTNLGPEEQAALLEPLQEANAQIRTAFPLDDKDRERIVQTLNEQIERKVYADFEVDEDLVCGIALLANGQQITWNIDSYLDHLEQEVRAALDEAIDRQTEEMAARAEAEEEHAPVEEDSSLEEKIEAVVEQVITEKLGHGESNG